MEILKEIADTNNEIANSEIVNIKITDSYVLINNKQYEKNTEINISGTSKNNYTLIQIVFFLLNKNLPYTKYLRECKEKRIASIFYSDQKIISEVLKSLIDKTDAFCDLPESRYISKYNYKWIEELLIDKTEKNERTAMTKKYKIIVSPSLTSIVNLNNIEILLNNGSLEKGKALIFDKTEFKINNNEFVAEEDVKNWTFDDWSMVVAIFCDGSDWQIKEWGIDDVASLFYKIPTFYFLNEKDLQKSNLSNSKIQKIFVKNNMISKNDYKLMWDKINNYIKIKK